MKTLRGERGHLSSISKLLICGLLAVCMLLISERTYAGNYVWTKRTNSPSREWLTVASSADGTKLVAGGNVPVCCGYLYTSTDSGATWTQRIQTNGSLLDFWAAVASSTDGTKLVAGTGAGGFLYTSTDSGVTWTERINGSTGYYWIGLASSSDGTKLAGVNHGSTCGYIVTSSNSGANWTKQTGAGCANWSAITSSSDGTKLATAVDGFQKDATPLW